MSKKNKRIITIAVIAIVGIVLFFVAASNIVVDECASACLHEEPNHGMVSCPDVCVRVTLLDRILGKG